MHDRIAAKSKVFGLGVSPVLADFSRTWDQSRTVTLKFPRRAIASIL